jgi:hypothetical protein
MIKFSGKTERYLEGLLSPAEKAEFEALLKTDASLAHRVETQQKLLELIKARLKYRAEPLGDEDRRRLGLSAEDELRIDDDLEAFYFPHLKNDPRAAGRGRAPGLSRRGIAPLLKFAAALALVLVVSLALLTTVRNNRRTRLAEQLYSEYFLPGNDRLLSGIEDKSRQNSGTGARSNLSPAENLLLLAIQNMKNEKYPEASQVFEELSFRSQAQVSDCAGFYQALNFLRLGDYNTARRLFSELCSNPGDYRPAACEISDLLNKK